VFAFGGPEEVVEMELPVDRAGIERATRFLGQSFRGGTDICAPLEKVIAQVEQERWQRADLLIATDGEFGATPEVAARLDAVKQTWGLRVQGVLIGDRETLGLMEVCDHIYTVRDWRRFGGILVDMLYDHWLSVHWPQFCAEPVVPCTQAKIGLPSFGAGPTGASIVPVDIVLRPATSDEI
jgi:hypothetical protein